MLLSFEIHNKNDGAKNEAANADDNGHKLGMIFPMAS